MREWQSQSHVRWYCRYHVVWVPKYRKRAIFGEMRRGVGRIVLARRLHLVYVGQISPFTTRSSISLTSGRAF